MIEITKEEATLCMEGLVNERKNLRVQATEFRDKAEEQETGGGEYDDVQRLIQAAERCEKRASEMNSLIDSLLERVKAEG